MVYCCILSCNRSDNDPGVSFHQVPTGETDTQRYRRQLWVKAIGRKDINYAYAKICSRHFVTGKPARFRENLSIDWVPTLCLDTLDLEDFNDNGNKSEDGNAENSAAAEFDVSDYNAGVPETVFFADQDYTDHIDILFDNGGFEDAYIVEDDVANERLDDGMDTRVHLDDMSVDGFQDDAMVEEWLDESDGVCFEEPQARDSVDETEIRDTYEKLLKEKDMEIRLLKTRLNINERRFDLKYFEGDDMKTRHFTGLPNFLALKIVFEYVQGGILILSKILTKEQVFVMVLMRLRLDLCFNTLGYLFDVATSTVAKYFYSGLYSIYQQLKGLVKWPEKELLKSHMPHKFKKAFPDGITSIIDCFEIYSEKPSTKDAIIKMFSNYKHHYTTKFLISITPFGTISFVSKPYSGRSSDKLITESCGYLDLVNENDIILADRGFTIQRAILEKGAILRVPDSSSRKKQLSSTAIERTRALASVRNEVERLIGALRGKYPILKGPVSIFLMNHEHNGVNVLYMIVIVCCALVNLCPSIIR